MYREIARVGPPGDRSLFDWQECPIFWPDRSNLPAADALDRLAHALAGIARQTDAPGTESGYACGKFDPGPAGKSGLT
jgi:hypothetical protein